MELLIINIASFIFVAVSIYQIFKFRNTMTGGALHHFYTHSLIIISIAVSVNLYFYNGNTIPILLVVLYCMQHVMKENRRLTKTSRWTPTVEDENER